MDIFNLVTEHPDIFVIIFQEKIVYCNENFAKLYGKPAEEIINKVDVLDLFPPEQRNELKKIKERRLKGEFFKKYHPKQEIITADKRRYFIKIFAQTTNFNGSPAGIAIGVDITDEVKTNYLLDLRQNLNKEIMNSCNIDHIFKYFTIHTSKSNIFKFTCIPVKDPDSMHFTPKYYAGEYDSNLINFFNNALYIDKAYAEKCFVAKNILANKIIIINDVEEIQFEQLKKELLLRDIHSIVCIPIYYNSKPLAIIGMFSEFRKDFDEKFINTFENLKQCIEMVIEKIKMLNNMLLIREAIDKEHSWIIIANEDAKIIYVNKTVEELSGYSQEELLGQNPRIFKSGCHNKSFYQKLWDTITQGKIFESIIINKSKSGKLFYLHDRIIPVTTPDGKTYYISIGKDVTNEYKLKNEIKRFQKYDLLTKLMNRNRFVEKATEKIEKEKGQYALMVLDIKDFKLVNQLYGRERGDELLKKIAEFLHHVTYADDLIARIGNDEFAVFVKINDKETLQKIINKFFEKIKRIDFYDSEIDINMGVAVYPKDASNVSELIEKALISLEISKTKGENEFVIYDSKIHDNLIKEKNTKEIIKHAIKEKQFVFHFQPYVDTKTLKPVGAESLLRIKQDGKIIYPDEFIDYAEKSGFVKEIEKIMFPKYVEYLKKSPIPLSFNISGNSMKDMKHVKNLFDKLSNDLTKKLVIELTERELAFNIEFTMKVFRYLKTKNIKISIDDFGTGFSSLTYLKNLPIDILKIDMSFIKNIHICDKDYAIVESVIDFAHKFNMKTIAEGVEKKEHIEILQKLGCDYLQGFYFAKPLPFDEFLKYLESTK